MAATLKLRRGTSTPSLVQSELFFNTTSNTLVVGDGSTNHTLVRIGSNTGDINLTGDISASNITITGNAVVQGNITFGGSLITLGDQDTDDIVFVGEMSSSLIPNNDNAFDIGSSLKRYKHLYAVSASIDELIVDGSGILSSSTTNFVDYSSSVDSRLDNLNLYTQSNDQRVDSIETFTQSIDTRVNTLETTFSSSVDSRLDLLETFSSSEYITDSSSFDTRLDTLEGSFSTSVDLRLDDLESTGSDHELRIDVIETTFSSSVDLRLDNAEWTGSNQESRIDILEASQSYFDNTFSGSVDLRLDNTEWTGSNHEGRITSIEGYSASLDSRLDDLEATGSDHENRLDTIEGSFSSSLDSRLNNLNLYTQSNDLRVDDLEATGSDHENRLDVIEGPLSSSINQQLDSIHSYTSSLKTAIEVSGQNLTVFGDLTVEGTTTTINTQELLIEDSLLAIASGSTTSTEANGAGFFISGADASILWNHPNQLLEFNTKISSSVGFKGDGSEITDVPYTGIVFDGSGIVSGSSQVDLTQTTNYVSGIKTRLNAEGIFSQSSQVNADSITNFDSNVKNKIDFDNVHSGSYLGTATTSNLTEGSNLYYQDSRVKTKLNTENVVSSSAQISGYNTFLEINGDSVFSGSSQVDLTQTTNYISGIKDRLNAETVISGSSQVTQSLDTRYLEINGDSVISSSQQISNYGIFAELNGDSLVSGSSQIDLTQTTNYNSFSSSLDSRLDSLETDQHTHSNKSNLDSIDQNLSQTDTPTFANASLTTLSVLGNGEVNAVFSGSAGTLGTRALGTAAFFNVSASVGDDPNSIPTNQAVNNALIAAGAGDLTEFNPTNTFNPNTTGLVHLSTGTEIGGVRGVQGNIHVAIDTGSTHFIDGVNGIVNIGDGVVSGSSQLTSSLDTRYLQINGDSVVSSSQQISNYGIFAELNGDGLVSSSAQISAYNTFLEINGDGVISGSSQITNGSGILSSSVQDFDTFSGSVDSRIDTLEGETHENPLIFADTLTIDFSRVVDTISANVIGGVVSSSAQISGYNTFLEKNGDNVVSSSQQISNYGIFAELNGDSLVSGSSQIDLTQTTNFTSFSSSLDSRLDNQELFSTSIDTTIKTKMNLDGVISGSSQIVGGSGIVSSSTQISNYNVFAELNGDGLVSSSAQISAYNTFLEINGDSVVSSSQQISNYGVFAELNGDGLVSSSAQISGYNTFLEINGDSVVSSSAQISGYNKFLEINGDSVVSGSDQLSGSLVTLNTDQTINGTKTFNDIVVNGTGSFAYIESVGGSAKIIGDAFVVVNTSTPTSRYAGLSVYDSGSANTTASFFFDGQTNDWNYEYNVGGTVDYGVAIFGPEYSTKGSPNYLTTNKIPKAQGNHHLNDSNISDSGTLITLGSDVQVNGNISLSGTVDGVDVAQLNTDFNTLKGKTLVSGSSQINHDSTTGFVPNEHIDHTTVTLTAGNGLTGGGTIAASREFNVGQGDGISVTADAVAVDGTVLRTTGDGVISGSSQVTLGGDLSGTANNATVTKVQNVALTSGEATQLANIDTTTISTTQWGYVGALNQGLTQTSTVQFGKVGVGGASDATYELKVTGDIGATGDVVAYISSDRRLKDEITPIENPLEKINSIGGYSFVWNENQHIYKGKDYGVIAQEIEEILPELVENRDNGYKAVKYDRLVSLLIEGVKELSKEVNELKSRMES